jgi:Trk-type K+ transport system membrane component
VRPDPAFANNYFILIVTGAAILIGNTLYPVFLRLIIWILSKIVPKDSETRHSLAFLLRHPRRCYLLLFPKKTTWYLLLIQVGINLLSWILFVLLNLGYPPVTSSIPHSGQRVMDGLYQAHSLRAAGYTIISISSVAPALQVFYLVVMYISAYPFIMSVRQTNVYEERSLGIDDVRKPRMENRDSGSSLLAVSVDENPITPTQ